MYAQTGPVLASAKEKDQELAKRPRASEENKKKIDMEYDDVYKANMVSEPMAMTYGMSDELRNSDLLRRISDLSLSDKQCLMRYISEEVEVEGIQEDEWDRQDISDVEPYTMEELYARIEASHQQYLRGEYQTEEEVREELRKEFSWLQ